MIVVTNCKIVNPDLLRSIYVLTDCPLCLPKPLNVVFLIDGSESISREDFASSVAWASNLVNIFRKLDDAYEYPTPAERREMRITVVQYSDDAALESDVNRKIDPSSIPFSISISRQMRQGTQPYRGLRFVNNNVALNKTFFNVLVAFNDGHTPNEPEDMDAVNTAKNNYDKILAVGLGDEFDFTQGFLKNIAHHTDPFHMNQTKPFENITECVKNESHEGKYRNSSLLLSRNDLQSQTSFPLCGSSKCSLHRLVANAFLAVIALYRYTIFIRFQISQKSYKV